MRILIEEYGYDISNQPNKELVALLQKVLYGIGVDKTQTIEGKLSISYVGYFYNPDIQDCVFILPKVLIDENGKVLGNEKITPWDLLDKGLKALQDEERKFIYEFAVWIYRALVVYKEHNDQSIIIEPKEVSQISHTRRRRTNTMLDVLLSLIQFAKDHQDFITFTLKNIHSGHNKINWTRTISRSQAILQDGAPIYLNPVNKKRQVNFDEELLIIFYSILNYIKEKYGFKVNINVNFQLIKGAQFESYINGRGVIRLRQIKYKYFSDIALELWELCNAFFDRSQNIYSACELKEFLLAKNFYIVFEAMIDELVGSNEEKKALDKKLSEQRDGKIVDHLFTYHGLIEPSEEQTKTYYIGDSKYYRIGASLEEKSIYKQYTYARNIIQYNIDLWENGKYIQDQNQISEQIRLRDELTEGYNVLPNFFISASMPKENFNIPRREIDKIPTSNKFENPTISYQFRDRLFDRDTLLLSRYNVNFLYIITLYARNNANEKSDWQKYVKDIFRKEIQGVLNEKFNFFAMKSKGNVLAGEQFLKDHFKELQGKLFRPYENINIYALALEKQNSEDNGTSHHVHQLLSDYFEIHPLTLGESPIKILEEKVGQYQEAHPYQDVRKDWLPEYHVERYEDAYFVIGMYRGQKHWDWITGKNDKGSLIYNVRLGDRDGAIVKSKVREVKPRFVILYNNEDKELNYRVFRVHDYAEMEKARMEKAEYPFDVKGDSYFIFRFDEEIRIGDFDIKTLVEEYQTELYMKYDKFYKNHQYNKGQPLFVTGADLMNYKRD